MKDHYVFLCLALFTVAFILLFVLGQVFCPDCAGDLIMLASIALGLFVLDLPSQ